MVYDIILLGNLSFELSDLFILVFNFWFKALNYLFHPFCLFQDLFCELKLSFQKYWCILNIKVIESWNFCLFLPQSLHLWLNNLRCHHCLFIMRLIAKLWSHGILLVTVLRLIWLGIFVSLWIPHYNYWDLFNY